MKPARPEKDVETETTPELKAQRLKQKQVEPAPTLAEIAPPRLRDETKVPRWLEHGKEHLRQMDLSS